ncbi:MAG: ATP-dependent Clp protease adaptor ClpS [Candidatus Bathyarchaeia archaeon]
MPVLEPQVIQDTANIIGRPYNVILFNDEVHSMEEVVAQIIKATGYSKEKASNIMLEAHLTGRAVVWTGHRERAEHIASTLEEIRLGTKVEPA